MFVLNIITLAFDLYGLIYGKQLVSLIHFYMFQLFVIAMLTFESLIRKIERTGATTEQRKRGLKELR